MVRVLKRDVFSLSILIKNIFYVNFHPQQIALKKILPLIGTFLRKNFFKFQLFLSCCTPFLVFLNFGAMNMFVEKYKTLQRSYFI